VTLRSVLRHQRFDRLGRDRDFRYWHFSDMANLAGDVRFRVKSRHPYYSICDWLLLAQSGRSCARLLPRSLLSITRLNMVRARPSIWSVVQIDQTCLGRSGGFAPVSLPLFQGNRLEALG
jgi:hypothetical protein